MKIWQDTSVRRRRSILFFIDVFDEKEAVINDQLVKELLAKQFKRISV
jgi:hypothetical protein